MSKKFIDLEGLKAYHDENVKALKNKSDKDHTHEGMVAKNGNGNIEFDLQSGIECSYNDEKNVIGFNEEGIPTILNRYGRYLQIATKSIDDDYNIYDFPNIALKSSLVPILASKTLCAYNFTSISLSWFKCTLSLLCV